MPALIAMNTHLSSRPVFVIACLLSGCSSGASSLPGSSAPPGSQTVAFDSGTTTVLESSGSGVVSLSLSEAVEVDVEITFDLGGSAQDQEDYTVLANPVVIPAGKTSIEIDFAIVADSNCEADETIEITLTSATGVELGGTITHELTISDAVFEELEPNDLPGQANPVTSDLAPGAGCFVVGSIEAIGAGDSFDVFSFVAIESTLVSIQLTPAGAADLVLWVTGVAGNVLAEFNDAGPGGTESGQLAVVLSSPAFHLVVWSQSGSDDYELEVSGAAPVVAGGDLAVPRVLSESRSVVHDLDTGRPRVIIEIETGAGEFGDR